MLQKIFGASYKTTITGLGLIFAGLGNAIAQWKGGGLAAVNITELVAAFVGGFGLIFAKDANVSNAPTPAPAAQVQLK